MRALSTSPMASVNLRFDKNFGFSPYGNICTCFPEIVYFGTRNMLPKTTKVFTCENGEDCLNLNGAKYAKLVDLEKGPSVAKMEIDTADNGPLLKTRRVFLAIFAFVLQRTLRLNRKKSGSGGTKPGATTRSGKA